MTPDHQLGLGLTLVLLGFAGAVVLYATAPGPAPRPRDTRRRPPGWHAATVRRAGWDGATLAHPKFWTD